MALYEVTLSNQCVCVPWCSGLAQGDEVLGWQEGMSRAQYLQHVQNTSEPWVYAALLDCVSRKHKLSDEAIWDIMTAQASVDFDKKTRGYGSFMEGNMHEEVALMEWTGFPVARTKQEIEHGETAMFPRGNVTGKLLALDSAGRTSRLYADVAPVPGLVNEKTGKPEWPPEKDACLHQLPLQLQHLICVPFHRVSRGGRGISWGSLWTS